jgi:long-subunit acyl-CoA synthetase (AMP-forming)
VWAIHRLSGIVSPASATNTAAELTHQLVNSKAKALFTCLPLLSTSLEAIANTGIPKSRVYLLDMPEQLLGRTKAPSGYMTVSQLIEEGRLLSEVETLKWTRGQGTYTTAFLCYSSGTSGQPVRRIISFVN